MRVPRLVLFVGLTLAGSPAAADTTAVYATDSKIIPMSMSVEIANDGSVRYQMSMGRVYGLVVGGVDYFVDMSSKSPVVSRVDDLVTAQKEAASALLSAFHNMPEAVAPPLVPLGTVTLNGRTGQAYGYKPENKEAKPIQVIVISNDPELKQLGQVMARQANTSSAMFSKMVGNTPSMFKDMAHLLETGAPLSIAGMELQSVNHAPIEASRFSLPATPETLDEIRERMKPLPPPPTATPTKP